MNPAGKHLLSLIGRILPVIILSTAIGWAWFYLLFQTAILGYVLIKPAVVIVAGVASGFWSRVFLRTNTIVLRWLTALLALFSAMLFMNYGSTGMVGFGFGKFNSVNWNGLWQFTLGGLMATVAIAAWRRSRPTAIVPIQENSREYIAVASRPVSNPVPVVHPAIQPKSSEKSRKTTSAAAKSSAKKKPDDKPKAKAKKAVQKTGVSKTGKQLAHQVATVKEKLKQAARSLNTTKPRQVVEPVIKVRVPASARVKQHRPVSAPAMIRPQKRHKPKISLMGMEEHRCPFCLEEVDPQDPAGVVICPVCHSYHHKSCWDITGTCQVPHSQS
jgi:hypothetical protein